MEPSKEQKAGTDSKVRKKNKYNQITSAGHFQQTPGIKCKFADDKTYFYPNLCGGLRSLSSRSGLSCGHTGSVKGAWRLLVDSGLFLSMEQPVSQHHNPRLSKQTQTITAR